MDPLKILDASILQNDPISAGIVVLDSIETNVNEVFRILKSLSIDKASGPDNIGNRILKNCASALAPPISLIINRSLESGVFPTQWKLSNVVPVYKKGDKQIKNNFRPISLLSCTSKVLEKVAYTKLY